MIYQLQIKAGLHFQVNSIAANVECTSFLQRSDQHLSLTYLIAAAEHTVFFDTPAPAYKIIFTFDIEYLQSFSASEDSFSFKLFPEQRQDNICCNSQLLLHEILTCTLTGTFRNMFLESKALALFLCLSKCYAALETACQACKFLSRPVEKEKLFKARSIILENLNNPPTIPELSLQTGINQCYLKKGFKELFGTTVYDFVQEQRMQKAKLLLITTGHSVAQVAHDVGFSSSGNFSQAFKRITGVFPSEFHRN